MEYSKTVNGSDQVSSETAQNNQAEEPAQNSEEEEQSYGY